MNDRSKRPLIFRDGISRTIAPGDLFLLMDDMVTQHVFAGDVVQVIGVAIGGVVEATIVFTTGKQPRSKYVHSQYVYISPTRLLPYTKGDTYGGTALL